MKWKEEDLSQRTYVCYVVLTLIDPSVLFTIGSKGMYSVWVTCEYNRDRLEGDEDKKRRE